MAARGAAVTTALLKEISGQFDVGVIRNLDLSGRGVGNVRGIEEASCEI